MDQDLYYQVRASLRAVIMTTCPLLNRRPYRGALVLCSCLTLKAGIINSVETPTVLL